VPRADNKSMRLIALLFCLLLLACFLTAAPAFDPHAATRAYLDRVPPAQKARSDAYFEGGYWLDLWNFLQSAAISVLLLEARWSARMRDAAARLTSRRPLQVFLYWLQYLAATSALALPLTIYSGFFRERQYGLSNMGFFEWLGDEAKGLALGAVFGGLMVVLLLAIVRRLPRTWWLWGTAVSVVFLAVTMAAGPVFIAPMFNTYTRLADAHVREPILRMARANGIEVSDVYQVNASRQSRRISANVSGFLGTERITLNDNLLNRCTLEQVESVMAHEMGHYVLNHMWTGLAFSAALALAAFAALRWSLDRALARRGERWGIRGTGDPAVLPLGVLVVSVLMFALTPVTNTFTRVQEQQADIFGLNAARQPDGFAEVALQLGEYRKLDPTPVEEFLFYDHPSGRTRIFTAMRFKAWTMLSARPASPPRASP
jgi:STE24 endopeptidase